MNHGPLLFLGVFFTLACSWLGLVVTPQLQLGQLQQTNIISSSQLYPLARPGLAQEGREVYRANGCVYCHTQQVRPPGFGADFERGWGQRRSVARDYVYDQPVMLGSLRLGPDLMNIGLRMPSEEWQLLHLYDPQILVKGSSMPPYRFLFQKRKIGRHASPEALKLTGDFAPETGYEIVPGREAKALAAYLLSLQAEAQVFETPLPSRKKPPTDAAATNAPPGAATNAPPGAATNAPAGAATNPPAK
ncbi:MAG: cbb3-type cytochrome c oxidase subunit II [Verrucomicrobiota bacterium]